MFSEASGPTSTNHSIKADRVLYMTIQVNITPKGRMSLPAELRKRHGLDAGGAVFVEETADGIVLRTAAQAVARAQAISRIGEPLPFA